MSISAVALAALAVTAAACTSGGTPAARPAGGAAKAASSANSAGGTSTAVSTAAGPATVTTPAQARQVFDGYVTQTDSALAAGKDSAALALTRSVPWRELTSAIATAKIRHTAVAWYRYGAPSFYIPATGGYPKWFVASVRRTASPGYPASLGGVPQAATGQALMVFEKMTARTPWQLSASAQLQPGQQMPKLAAAAGGGVETARMDDDTSYLARPDVTGPLQAAVVDEGPAAPAATAVASGPFTTGMYQRQAAMKTAAGYTRQWTLQGSKYDRFALRTASGGAFVFYAMYLHITTEARPGTGNVGRPIAVPPETVPLLSPAQRMPRSRLKTEYTMTFAAIDPPASASNAKIQVVAMDGAPSWASGS